MKKILSWVFRIVLGLLILIFLLIGLVDYTPLIKQEFFQHTIKELAAFQPTHHAPKSKLKVGWSVINITPKSPMPMAGYAPRDRFDSVHDSIYIRIMSISNGTIPCFIISADLLLFPSVVKNKIRQLQKESFIYFTATHSHSSIGGWEDSAAGNILLGSYHSNWVDSLVIKINAAMNDAKTRARPASLYYVEANANEFVENRLDPTHGVTDGIIRGLKIFRDDGSKGLFVSYGAHPTNISDLSRALSGDYPAAIVKKAEQHDFDFAIFGAGMMGSHRVKGLTETEFLLCDSLAEKLYRKIKLSTDVEVKDSTLYTALIPIDYGPSQLHLTQNFKLRNWVFNLLFRKLKGEIQYLKIGNIILLGTPCDFSGEIFARDGLGKLAEHNGNKLLITSFNGDYVGYITYDQYYGHSEQEEVMVMNWVGPYYGNYYSQIMKKILSAKD